MENYSNEIKKCVDVLKSGGIILYPTDTIWGIGCDATNIKAVEKIFRLKNRSDSKSLIILLSNENQLLSYVREIPEVAYSLIEYSEKPLTIIYPGARNLAKNVIGEDGSVGIRIPKDEFCIQLTDRFRKPLVSTSANISGQPSPAGFSDIDPAVVQGVDYVVNLRQHEKSTSPPSSIIKLGLTGEIHIIRK